MDRSTPPAAGYRSALRSLLIRTRQAAWNAVLGVFAVATVALIAGTLGAVVLKPIVSLICWVWAHSWPA